MNYVLGGGISGRSKPKSEAHRSALSKSALMRYHGDLLGPRYRVGRSRRHDILMSDVVKMLEAQDGVCALCGGAPVVKAQRSPKSRKQWFDVDHDHKTGRVRGILCHRCNAQLSLVELVGLDKIARYLES